MGYRRIAPKLIQIDDLIKECGLFVSKDGYGCKSKSKKKSEPDLCYVWDCPLGHEAALSDVRVICGEKSDDYKEYLDCYQKDVCVGNMDDYTPEFDNIIQVFEVVFNKITTKDNRKQ